MSKLTELFTKISLEAVSDIAQQYFDDVSQNERVTIDKELAQELGVTPTALAELLEVNRHTFQYANIGGVSSVRGYDHGEDWMVVMFSDGSRYLYTLRSTTRESLDTMRQYAIEGKGLNSYIMRMQRFNYAGRNVKGEILIKPGMEQFNPACYKRLKLIEAFRNTMNTQISNEGIVENVKKFFNLSNKGKGAEMSRSTTVEHISISLQLVRSTFANKDWMAKQTFVTKPINGSGIVDVIGSDNILKALSENDKFLKSFLEWYKVVFKRTEDIYSLSKEHTTPEALAKAVAKLPKLKYTKSGSINKSLGTQELTSLDEATALKASREIVKQLKDITSCYMKDANLLYFKFTKGFSGQDIFYNDPEFSKQYDEFRDRLFACLKWIDRSIKGKTTVGNEVYVKSTLKKYRGQIDAAGVDGLTPVAQQIMQVGLEAIGVKGIALENHDVGKELTTDKLKQAIDSRLTEDSE